MMLLEKIESKIKRIDEDLTNSRARAEELKVKIAALEKEREDAENMRIVIIVRDNKIEPEVLKQLLSMQAAAVTAPEPAIPAKPQKPEKQENERKFTYETETYETETD